MTVCPHKQGFSPARPSAGQQEEPCWGSGTRCLRSSLAPGQRDPRAALKTLHQKSAGEAVTVLSAVSAGLGLFACFPTPRTHTGCCPDLYKHSPPEQRRGLV